MFTLITTGLKHLLKHNFQVDYLNRQAFTHLSTCHRILDVGCGAGEFIKLAPQKIIGLDSNRVTVKLCRQQGLHVIYGSATKLPFPAQSFDGLNCAHVIEHLYPHQVYAFLREATRVLKPKGVLVISTPLLWPGFYNNLTHIKPYPPPAIMRYLVESAPDTTFPPIKSKFKLVALHWRYRPISNLLYPLGIHTLSKDGYTLVLKRDR